MDTLSALRAEGRSIDELHEWIEENKLRLNHWFFSTDLSFYIKGGRISKTAGAIGKVLNICPLLNMDNLGRLIPRYKIRTKKKVIQAIVDRMAENAREAIMVQRQMRPARILQWTVISLQRLSQQRRELLIS